MQKIKAFPEVFIDHGNNPIWKLGYNKKLGTLVANF